MKLNRTKKGFTIVELVIVIAVIGVLSAILIPTFANLTNDARAAANKQQVADAYTAYLVEAVNDQYDDLFTRSGDAPDYEYTAYTAKTVALAQKSQNEVVLKLGTSTYYTYDTAKGGWNIDSTISADPAKLVASCEDFPADLELYHQEGTNSYVKLFKNSAKTTLTDLSTFNDVVIFVKAA